MSGQQLIESDVEIEFENDTSEEEIMNKELDDILIKAAVDSTVSYEPAPLVIPDVVMRKKRSYRRKSGTHNRSSTIQKPRKVRTDTTNEKIPIKKMSSKKGPGRPRKTPKKEPIPRTGISLTPTDPSHVVELLYDSPIVLKKIVAFFKSLASSQIQIIFRRGHIIFYAKDHHKKSKIRIKIDGDKMNHYYCEREIDMGVSCRELELILNRVDKEYNSIVIIVDRKYVQKNIMVMLRNNDIQINEMHTIDVNGNYTHIENEQEFIDEDYTIQFTLPGKYFRKTINDIKTMTQQLSIQQDSMNDALEFGYSSPNKKIRSCHTFNSTNRINLISKLTDNDSFRVDIKIDYIKPISSAHIADKITIFVDENKNMMTKALIDNEAIEIKTLTEIIDDRPDDE